MTLLPLPLFPSRPPSSSARYSGSLILSTDSSAQGLTVVAMVIGAYMISNKNEEAKEARHRALTGEFFPPCFPPPNSVLTPRSTPPRCRQPIRNHHSTQRTPARGHGPGLRPPVPYARQDQGLGLYAPPSCRRGPGGCRRGCAEQYRGYGGREGGCRSGRGGCCQGQGQGGQVGGLRTVMHHSTFSSVCVGVRGLDRGVELNQGAWQRQGDIVSLAVAMRFLKIPHSQLALITTRSRPVHAVTSKRPELQ